MLDRYARQIRFQPIGEQGQRRLLAARAVVCGCGALGNQIANLLVRAGVGHVRVIDRDVVDLSNLHRQTLFTEEDARAGAPKAIAAAERLRAANSEVRVEPVVADIGPETIERLCEDADVIIDGCDNFETRFVINDYAVKNGLPWVFGGCVGTEGQVMTVLPGETPCLRCVVEVPPAPGAAPTCDSVGVLGPIVGVVASVEAMEALKILSGARAAVLRKMFVVDLWTNQVRMMNVSALKSADCPTCARRDFSFLAGRGTSRAAILCGRNAVQLASPDKTVSLEDLAARLTAFEVTARSAFLVRFKVESFEITVFADGRAIVAGTDDIAVARTAYAKYVGM